MMRWPTNGSFKGCVQRDLTRVSPELLPGDGGGGYAPGTAGGSWGELGCNGLCCVVLGGNNIGGVSGKWEKGPETRGRDGCEVCMHQLKRASLFFSA